MTIVVRPASVINVLQVTNVVTVTKSRPCGVFVVLLVVVTMFVFFFASGTTYHLLPTITMLILALPLARVRKTVKATTMSWCRMAGLVHSDAKTTK